MESSPRGTAADHQRRCDQSPGQGAEDHRPRLQRPRGWGKGFVLAVSRRWPEPERAYRLWHRQRADNDFGLGATQLVQVQPHTWVANMIAQHGMRTGSGGPPIRYDAVERCLAVVAEHATRLSATVHMPRIGCGLAGGRWERIEPLITATLCDRDIATTVYDHD